MYIVTGGVNCFIRAVLDEVFGRNSFRNEIVLALSKRWTSGKIVSRKHDNIYLYSKSDKWIFNADAVGIPRR